MLVPAHLTRLPAADSDYFKHRSYEAIPKSHQTANHVASSYCNPACIVIARMIFDMADMEKMVLKNQTEILAAYRFHMVQNPGLCF